MTDPTPLALPAADDATAWAAWVTERCDGRLADARGLADRLRAGELSGAAALVAFDDLGLAVRDAAGIASLLSNVHPDADLREQAERAEQAAVRLETDVSLDRGVFDVLAGLDAAALDPAAGRVLDRALRDFRRAGVDRDEPVRDRLRALADQETELGQRFSRVIREDVRSVRFDPAVLAGMPEDYVAAHPAGDDGLVEVTTDYPDLVPFLSFCADREARAALLHAFWNRGWPANDAVLRELLEARREHARLLGYDGWPAYDAEVKMVGSGKDIAAFVDELTALAGPVGERDVAQLLDRVRRDHPDVDTLTRVDKDFYAEVLRRELFDVDAQQVRRYFDFAAVRDGLLSVTGRLFDVDYVAVDAPSWHADVASYDVRRGGRTLGRIHLDLHPRAGKYGHAAMFELASGRRDRQLPEGVLVCNFSRSLMEHSHVVTLFHEFGHLVHHVLGGDQEWTRFSGVATEWDFVEAPSQMLEEWAWDPDVLGSFARDADGTPIPRDLVARMRSADELGTGLHVRTQSFYSALSYALHQEVPEDLTARMRELQARYDLLGYVPDTHFFASFGHLSGYGSGYYTYLWSKVIATDLFSAFDRDDLFAPEVAHRYRDEVLARGGSADAADLVAAFLGRPYDMRAFEAWLTAQGRERSE